MNEFVEKIINMIRRGAGAERDVAERKLREYCQKNNLDYDNLLSQSDMNEVRLFLFFRPKKCAIKNLSLRLFRQICAMVLNVDRMAVMTPKKGGTNEWWIKCTKMQKIEIDVIFSMMHPAFESEYEILLDAFIQKNHIFPADGGAADPDKIDMKRAEKVLGMARYMEAVNPAKQIEKK